MRQTLTLVYWGLTALAFFAMAAVIYLYAQGYQTRVVSDAAEPAPIPETQTSPSDGVVRVEGRLVEGFPTNIPIFPSLVVEESIRITDSSGDVNYRTTWVTETELRSVLDWYMTELNQNGWTIENMNRIDVTSYELGIAARTHDQSISVYIELGGLGTEVAVWVN